MTEQELIDLINEDEGQRTEFKVESEKPGALAEILQGFVHSKGGYILIGITDNGQLVGVARPKNIMDRLKEAASRLTPSLLSYLQLQTVNFTELKKQVVVAYVPALPNQLFMLNGAYHTRQGSYTVAMTGLELRQRMSLTGQVSTEDLAVPFATLNDIDQTKFYQYLQKRNPNPEGPNDLLELLRRAGFIVQDKPGAADSTERPTVACLLLFGKNPQEFNPLFQARLKAARFTGNEPVYFLDQAELIGPIPNLIEEGLRFIRRNTRHPLVIDPARSGTARAVQLDEYPEAALREALINALCHRDYYIKRPTYLKIFDDRIEIENPGGLYQRERIEEVRGLHIPRNPNLANALQVLGFVEQFGTGLYRMERTMAEAHLPPPQFNYRPDNFQISLIGPGLTELPRPGQDAVELNTTPAAAVETAGKQAGETAEERELAWLLEQIGGKNKPATRKRQARATLYVRLHGSISRTQYTELNGVKPYTARDELKELVELEIFELSGSYRSSVYRLRSYQPRV